MLIDLHFESTLKQIVLATAANPEELTSSGEHGLG